MTAEILHKPAGMRLNRSIVLVGLMGAGKSSVGKRLAHMLQVPFLDSDTEIETAANMPIAEIFRRYGEQSFRDGEQKVIARLVAGTPCVLATGGGAFVAQANRDVIGQHGISVWLRAAVDTLHDRVKNKPGRPLLQTGDARAVLERLLAERSPTYGLADVIVESTPGIAQELMASRIIEAIMALDAAKDRVPPTLQEVAE